MENQPSIVTQLVSREGFNDGTSDEVVGLTVVRQLFFHAIVPQLKE